VSLRKQLLMMVLAVAVTATIIYLLAFFKK